MLDLGSADTPVRNQGQAGACPDRTRAILCTLRAGTGAPTAGRDCGRRARSAGERRELEETPARETCCWAGIRLGARVRRL